MRKGTHHSARTRLAIRLKRLEKSMPPDEFARFTAGNGTLKWCPACEHLLDVGEFHKNRRAWDGLYDRCKTCNAAIAARWHSEKQQDPEYREQKNRRAVAWRAANKGEKLRRANKNANLKQLYGITLEQFEAMLAAQRNRCAICLRRFTNARDTHVDHNHVTGVVRGILCTSCNNGLGRFRDDPAVLRRAARYLIAAQAVAVPAGDGCSELRRGDTRQLDLLADCDRAVVRVRPGADARDVPAGVGVQ